MKPEEQMAATYLGALGLGSPKYEPDGNIPPDFLLSASIAVEVRRLNKHVEVNGKNEGLEQAEIPLMKTVEATLRSFDKSWAGSTYFAFIRFSRPIPARKTLASRLATVLKAFLQDPSQPHRKIFVDPALSIDLISATPVSNRTFLIGGNSDPDRGGWVVDDYRANIQLCSDEKAAKVANYRAKYATWWLLLVDFIGYGLDEFDREQLKRSAPIAHGWNKIVVINPSDPSHAFEV
jgi:hypothetical protein